MDDALAGACEFRHDSDRGAFALTVAELALARDAITFVLALLNVLGLLFVGVLSGLLSGASPWLSAQSRVRNQLRRWRCVRGLVA